MKLNYKLYLNFPGVYQEMLETHEIVATENPQEGGMIQAPLYIVKDGDGEMKYVVKEVWDKESKAKIGDEK